VVEDIRYRRWIKVKIFCNVNSLSVFPVSKKLNEYCEYLGWKLKKELIKDNNGNIYSEVKCVPNWEDTLSPQEFQRASLDIYSCADDFAQFLNFDKEARDGSNFGPVNELLKLDKPEEYQWEMIQFKTLKFEYAFADRCELEKIDQELSNDVFLSSISKDLNEIGLNTDDESKKWYSDIEIQRRLNYKKKLKEYFGVEPKVTE